MSADKPRLFIHIGSHKTGSSAIQQAFRSKETGIEEEGLIRIECDSSITKKDWEPRQEQVFKDHLKSHICADTTHACRYLLSYEGFCGNAFQGYPNASTIASRLRAVTMDFDVKIIVFLRRQDDFIESMYTQMIHQGGSRSFQDFITTTRPESMDWHRLLESYAAVFDRKNLIVRRYHADFYPKSDSLIVDFAGIVGVRPECLKKKLSLTRNQGYSSEAVELARLCNPSLSKTHRALLREMLQEISPKPLFRSYSYLDLKTRQDILAACAVSNEKVKKDYFSSLGDTPLFPAPCDAGVDEKQAADEPLIPRLVTRLLEYQEAEKRSRLLRLAMRLERFWHQFWRSPN